MKAKEKPYKDWEESYELYGDEWKKEIRKLFKPLIIELYKEVSLKKIEVKKKLENLRSGIETRK